MGKQTQAEKRRSDRLTIAMSLQVTGMDQSGQRFMEQVRTLSVSRDGATIVVRRELTPGQQVIIRRPENDKTANARVVGQIGGQPHGYVYGLALPNPGTNLWDILFPPLADADKAVLRLLLECTGCRAHEIVYLNELETEVFEASSSLSRACQSCSDWTVWKQAPSEVPAEHLETQSNALPESHPASKSRAKKGRKEVRVHFNEKACIRHPGFGEEVVHVENVSRGGLCFHSSKAYLEGSRIEVAVPYSPGAPCIFVPARIVRARELPGKGLKKYGVTYARPSKGSST